MSFLVFGPEEEEKTGCNRWAVTEMKVADCMMLGILHNEAHIKY